MKTLYVIPLLTGIAVASAATIQPPATIGISTSKSSIAVGEPLIVALTYKFDRPPLVGETGRPVETVPRRVSIHIKGASTSTVIPRYGIPPGVLRCIGENGSEYNGQFVLLFNHKEKTLIFARPGLYQVTALEIGQVASNELQVTVKEAATEDTRAAFALSDPMGFAYLQHPEADYLDSHPQLAASLREIVEHHEDAVLGMWAAACLGLESYRNFRKQVAREARGGSETPRGTTASPLVADANSLLSKALHLPDEFPIREQVLHTLAHIVSLQGDRERAAVLRQELAVKYPHGQYGRRYEEQH